ncbi:Ig-like domain-containing protein [Dactylosporangium sp. NPDC049525]|uniref:Ig-like domain-containing protein n=1 Tax=Dactylosporangium sp. NPDC049525 TaxID=3154730 RepID=UPI00341D468E
MAFRSVRAGFAIVLLAAALSGVWPRPAAAEIVAAFRPVYSVNDSGAVVLRGNANLTCDGANPGCATARNATVTGGALNNNGYRMRNVDVDAEPSFNSSTADLPVPTGATVLYAGLFWGGDTEPGTGTPAPDEGGRNTVRFKVPGGAYRTITANRVTDVTTFPGHRPYQGYADVSALVAGAGAGTYAVADIQAATGVNDRYAAWSLAVVLHDPAQPVRNMVVYDGFGSVRGITPGDATVTIPVTGFQTPPTGTVTTSLGAVAYEGDGGSGGDSVRLDGTPLADALSPATNFFNSTISDHGAPVTARTPADANLLGFDIDHVDASGVLANGANSATITLQTTPVTGETFYPGVITFATDLDAPRLTALKSATDVNGGLLERGDEIRYTIQAGNDGLAPAEDTRLADAVPPGTVFVPGSLSIDGATQSDPVDTDRAEISAGVAGFRVGTGSDADHGGRLAPGESVTVSYRVTAGAPGVTGAATLLDVAHVAATGADTGVKLRAPSNATTSTLPATAGTDLAVTAGAGPQTVQGTGAVTYPVTVTNTGADPATGVTLTAVLPDGVTGTGATPSAGACTLAGQTLTCPVGALPPGATFTVDVAATVTAAAAHHTTMTATVTSATPDPAGANNTATAAVVRNAAPGAVPDTATVAAGGSTAIPVAANDADPDGDTPRVLGIATPPVAGHAIVDAAGVVRYTAGPVAGTDTFIYTVGDGLGGTATATVTVTVTAGTPPAANAAPVAAADTVTAAATGTTFDPLANDTDADGDPLTVVGAGPPAGGTVVLTAAGQLTYTPGDGFRGADSFQYTVDDGHGGHSTATVNVTVANRAPVAAADERGTPAGTALDVAVLANDTDPNPGDVLTVTAWDATAAGGGTVMNTGGVLRYTPAAGFTGDDTFTYTVDDGHGGASTGTVTVHVGAARPPAPRADAANTPTGTPVAVAVLANDTGDTGTGGPAVTLVEATPGAYGTTTVAGGVVTYTPRPGFSGVDVFRYAVADGRGGLGTAAVTVTVFNEAPAGVADTLTVPAGTAAVVPVLANDTDANADTLRAVAATGAAHGTLQIVAGAVRYTPAAGYRGADAFTYTLSDGNGGASTAAVTVNVSAAVPVAASDTATTAAGTPVGVAVLTNDTPGGSDPGTLAVTGVGAPGHGTAVLDGDGTVTYTPAAGFTGVDTFTYTLSAGAAPPDTATGTVTVTVTSATPAPAPAPAPIPAPAEPTGSPVVVSTPTVTTPTGSGAQTITPLDNVTDPDGDPLKVLGVTQPANGSAVLNADGTVTYTPDRGFSGTDSFAYTVTDGTTAVAGTVELMVGSVDLPITGPPVAPHTLAGLLMLLAGSLLRVGAVSGAAGHRPGSRASAPTTRRRSRRP